MSFGNIPKDFSCSSIAALRSTASKSTNGFFSANLRTVGSLLQYEHSPNVWVTAADTSHTAPATQLGNSYTLPAPIAALSLNLDGSVLAVSLASVASGSVLSILTNTAGYYSQQAIPLPPDAVGVTTGSVSLDVTGEILAFGSGTDNGGLGAVWLYADIAGVWTLQGTKLTGPGEIGLGNFGMKVSLSGDATRLAVSSSGEGTSGAAYIFNVQTLANPVLITKIVPSSLYPDAVFGYDVDFSADGSTLAVGASSISSTNGSVFIFTKVQGQGQWTQQAYLPKPPGFTTTYFAYNVSLSADGNILAASSSANCVIYYRSGRNGTWSSGNLLPLPYDLVGTAPPNQYFAIISQDGNSICTSNTDNNGNVGASWIFTQGPPETWTQNGPALIGSGAPITATVQGYSILSGNGKVVAVQDNSNQALLWIFV